MGEIVAAIAGAVTVILMFRPWLTASGPNGRLSSNAFGQVDGASESFTSWLPGGGSQAQISGCWAILAALAAVVTIATVTLNLRYRSSELSILALGSAVATAVFVLADLLYLGGETADLRTMVESDQGGTGGIMGMFLGNNTSQQSTQVASAGLATAALLGGATAFGGALAAIASNLHKRTRYTYAQVPIEQRA